MYFGSRKSACVCALYLNLHVSLAQQRKKEVLAPGTRVRCFVCFPLPAALPSAQVELDASELPFRAPRESGPEQEEAWGSPGCSDAKVITTWSSLKTV